MAVKVCSRCGKEWKDNQSKCYNCSFTESKEKHTAKEKRVQQMIPNPEVLKIKKKNNSSEQKTDVFASVVVRVFMGLAVLGVMGLATLLLQESEAKKDQNTSVTTSSKLNVPNASDDSSVEYVEDVWLTDMNYIKKDEDVIIKANEKGMTNTGDEYSHYMYSHSPYSEIYYNLDGNYDILEALWSVCYSDRNATYNNSFDVYADETLVYSSPSITGGDLPVNLSVDISGCKVLTILFKEGEGAAELANIRLRTNSKREFGPTDNSDLKLPCWLTDLEYLYASQCIAVSDYYFKTNVGDTCAHVIYDRKSYEHSDESIIEYYLKGNYSRLSGVWAIFQQDRNTQKRQTFEIYADDNLVYTSPSISGGDLPIEFDINISNCNSLRIVFHSTDAAMAGNLRLYP